MIQTTQATHPGAHLQAKYLTPLGISTGQAAAAVGCTEYEMAAVLEGSSPVTLGLAMRLARSVGDTADYWLSLQCAYDVTQAEPLPPLDSSAPPLESVYWGEPVASFSQEIPWHGNKGTSCLITCAFSPDGRPTFVLSQRGRYQSPSLTMCCEYHAVACINTMATGPNRELLHFVDERGFAYFRARCERARKAAIERGEKTLHGVSREGNISWVEHYLQGTNVIAGEMVTTIGFGYKNTPSILRHLSAHQLLNFLGPGVRDVIHAYARD
jgi:addiction module HigA family antidote